MNVYQTDKDGYFVGATEATKDPKDGSWLIPGGCVTATPPTLAANETAQWISGAWVKVPDLRGKVYWLADRSRHEITERGVSIPAGALDAEPPKSQAEIDAEDSVAAKAALISIDLASIRAIREYIVSHPDAPQLLKDRESAAAAQRVKVK